MDFIIGGCHQGKTEYVREKYSLRDDEILDAEELLQGLLAGGSREDGRGETVLSGKRCLNHFHQLVKGLCERGISVEDFLDALFAGHSFEIIITDEIGCGVVPIDEGERYWREVTGRQCCKIAQRAERMERVYCGVATVIKGGIKV